LELKLCYPQLPLVSIYDSTVIYDTGYCSC